jgi:hypothetical protein
MEMTMKRIAIALIATAALIGSISPVAQASSKSDIVIPLPRPNPLAEMKTREDTLRAIAAEKAAAKEAEIFARIDGAYFAVAAVQEDVRTIRMAQVQDPNFNFPNRVNPPAPVPTVVASTPAVAAPAVPAAPVVVTTAGPDLHGWASNGLLGLISGLLTWIGLKKSNAVAGTSSDDHGKVGQIIAALTHPSGTSLIGDPALRATVDAALARVIQSGVPGTAIQTGLSLIPGAGPIASSLEPMLRNVVVRVLQERAGTNADPVAPANVSASGGAAMLDKVADLIKLVKGGAANVASAPVPETTLVTPSPDVVAHRFDRLEATIATLVAQLQAKAAVS